MNWVYVGAQTTVVLSASKDNSLFEEDENESNGSGSAIFAGKTGFNNDYFVRRALIQFDLSAIPPGATITSVKCSLAVLLAPNQNSHPMTMHRVLTSWGEGTSASSTGEGEMATANDATWRYNNWNSSEWDSLGGDFIIQESASDMVSFSNFPLMFGIWEGPGMVADVQAWVDGPNTNFGWIIIGDENTNLSAKKFGSREGPAVWAPKLEITYQSINVESVLINEVNTHEKWVEIHNPGSDQTDINGWFLCAGGINDTIGGSNVTVLHGDLQLDSNEFVVLSWSHIDSMDGELSLFDSISFDTTSMVDYVQWGSGNHDKAGLAELAGVWNDSTAYLTPPDSSDKSLSLLVSASHASGKDTDSTSWQASPILVTPAYQNIPCPSDLSLAGNIVEASYYASNTISSSGLVTNGSNILFASNSEIVLTSNFNVQSGASFETRVMPCPN